MKKFFTIFSYVFFGLMLLGGGISLAVVNPFSAPQEEVSAQYTATFSRTDNVSTYSTKVFIRNANTGKFTSVSSSGGSTTLGVSKGDWCVISIDDQANWIEKNYWIYGYNLTSTDTGTWFRSVNELWFVYDFTSNQTIKFGVDFHQTAPLSQVYNANGGSLEENNTTTKENQEICNLAGRSYQKSVGNVLSIAGWGARLRGWRFPILIGTEVDAASVVVHSLGPASGGVELSYNETTYYYTGGTADYNALYLDTTTKYTYVSLFNEFSSSKRTGLTSPSWDPKQEIAKVLLDTYKEKTHLFGNTLRFPVAPKRAGFVFAGWSLSQDGSTGLVTEGSTISSNTQLYAIWNLELDPGEGTASVLDTYGTSSNITPGLVCTLGGRSFYKTQDGPAIVTLFDMKNSSGTWRAPFLISTSKTGTQFRSTYHDAAGKNDTYGYDTPLYYNQIDGKFYHSLSDVQDWQEPYLIKLYCSKLTSAMPSSNADTSGRGFYKFDTVESVDSEGNLANNVTAVKILNGLFGKNRTLQVGVDTAIPDAYAFGRTFLGWYTKDGSETGEWGVKIENLEDVEAASTANGSGLVLHARFSPNTYAVEYETNGGTLGETKTVVSQAGEVIFSMIDSDKDYPDRTFVKLNDGEAYVCQIVCSWLEGNIWHFPLLVAKTKEALSVGFYYTATQSGAGEVTYDSQTNEDFRGEINVGGEKYYWLAPNAAFSDPNLFGYIVDTSGNNLTTVYGETPADCVEKFMAGKCGNFEYGVDSPLAQPTKTGHTFKGWYYDEELTLKYNGTPYFMEAITFDGTTYETSAPLKLYAKWEINTYTLEFDNGYYYSSSGYTVSLSAPGCSITNSTLSLSNDTSIVSHTYSTEPITVTLTCNDAYLWFYIDLLNEFNGLPEDEGFYSVSWEWTPNASRKARWYIRELWDMSSVAGEGVESATYSSNSNTHPGASGYSNLTSSETIKEGAVLDFTAVVKNGYVFDGWYDASGTLVSANSTYTPTGVSSNLTLTARATKIYDMIEYYDDGGDGSGNYFYFVEGLYPQSMVSEEDYYMLEGEYGGEGDDGAAYFLNLGGQECPVYDFNEVLAARVIAPKTVTKVVDGVETTFSQGDAYWFYLEPIVWRVSGLGVSENYYSEVLFDRFEDDGGVVYGVSDLVLDYGFVDSELYKSKGWKYQSSDMHRNLTSNFSALSDNFANAAAASWNFDVINAESTNTKMASYEGTMRGFVQASVRDIDRIFQQENYEETLDRGGWFVNHTALETKPRSAKASDLACMLAGVNSTENCVYGTRDLYNNKNNFKITQGGFKGNVWFDGSTGVRLGYAIKKKGVVDFARLNGGNGFAQKIKRWFDSSLTYSSVCADVSSITFDFYRDSSGQKTAEESYFVGGVNITTNEWIDTSIAKDASIKAYFVKNTSDLTDIYVLSSKHILVNDGSYMFSYMSEMRSLTLNNFDTSKVTTFHCMIRDCPKLESLDVSSFNTSNVTDMSNTFIGCESLTELDLSNFNTSKVTNMGAMLAYLEKVKKLDLSNFDTSKVTNMAFMFCRNYDMEELDISGFDTSNVTTVMSMFHDCVALKEIDVSHFNTSKTENMGSMFYGCEGLTILDLTSFDTSNVTDMNHMFYYCDNLLELDLSSFDTSKVTNMSGMFQTCTNLKTIYVGDGWTTTAVTSTSQIFTGCDNIVGQNGTRYNYWLGVEVGHLTLARVDGKDGLPGYLTYKANS